MKPIVILLVTLACLSPTLTLLSLWQVKEWRFDRLIEHLKREGLIRQLYGSLRPKILAASLLLTMIGMTALDPVFVKTMAALGLLCILAVLSCIQILLRKQPTPVWTSKATLMLILSLVAAFIPLSLSIHPSFLALGIIPFLCPFWVLLGWIITKPIDVLLKSRTIRNATEARRRHPSLTVIGITGSVGKTTTKELLAHILKKRGAIATPAHVNTEMGVAAWLLKILAEKPADWPGILIVEMGAYRKGEIKLLANIAKPHLGIITFIGLQHLSLFGSLEAIRDAKGELFAALPKNGHAFMNHDNAASESLKNLSLCPVTTVGTDGRANISAFDIEETGEGIRFTVRNQQFVVPIAGTHTVTSILFAIGVAEKLGMDLKTIASELRSFKPLARTFEVKHIRGITVLDDTYNASPDSFRAAIHWAQSQPEHEKVLLTDGIIELGSKEESVHRELAKEAANVFSKVCIGNARFLKYFRKNGFGDRAVLLSTKPAPLHSGSLLVCIGRVPRTAIDELLPTS